jgi:glycosyltransferase involved in cell wall biosynthesis
VALSGDQSDHAVVVVPVGEDMQERRASIVKLGDLAAEAGLRRIHLLAWRDVADVEAGGSELHAASVARLWAEAGIEVTVRTSYAQGSPPESTRNGYRVIRRAGRYLVFPRAVTSELLGRHGQRDGLVEIWNGVPWLTPLWASGPKVTWLHHIHGPMWGMVLPPRLARAGDLLERRVAPPLYRRQAVVTLSESSKAELLAIGFRPDRVSVVSPGIHTRFSPGGPRSLVPLVVAVGRLMPVKRFDALIETMAEVRRLVPTAELVVVGEGAEREHLEDLVEQLDAADWVHLPGRLSDDELVALYRSAWLVASASVAEGWGMTLTEAAACGTPAVATDIGGHRDAVVAGSTGVLVPPDELAAAIARMLLDDQLRAALADAALERASTFSWEATAAGTLEVLAREVARRRAT